MGPIDPHDAVPIRVLKTLLRSNIPNLRPRVQEAINQAFKTCMNDGRSASDGMTVLVMKGPFLIRGNNLQGGSLSTPIISRRRSVFESTTRSFSVNALVNLVHDRPVTRQCLMIAAENHDFFQATRGYHRQALFAMLTSHYFPHWTHK